MHEINTETLVSFLSRTPLFNGLKSSEILACLDAFDILEVPEGRCIFLEGDKGNTWYLVLEGRVEITKATPIGPNHIIGDLETGDSFGEMALVDGTVRMASAHATNTTTLAALHRDRFHDLVRDNAAVTTQLLWAMSRVMARRLRHVTELLIEIVDEPLVQPTEEMGQLYDAICEHISWN